MVMWLNGDSSCEKVRLNRLRRFDARTYACCTKYSKGVGWGGLKFVLSAASFVTSTCGEKILNTSRILPAWIGCPCVFSLLCFRGR